MLRDSFGIIWDPSEGQEQGGWGCKSSRTSSMTEYIRPIQHLLFQFNIRYSSRLISGSAIPSLSISVENSVEDDDNVSSSLCSLFLSKHIPYHAPKLVCSMFRSKVIISLHEDVLGLLQPLHLVLDFQIDLRLTKMVPHDSPCQKRCGLTPKLSH